MKELQKMIKHYKERLLSLQISIEKTTNYGLKKNMKNTYDLNLRLLTYLKVDLLE